jgi:short-subunit dehydrogenase
MKTYAGKTALVTGASSGIGKALAEDLARRGARLILVARSKDRLDALANTLPARSGAAPVVIAMDLAEAGAATRLAAEADRLGLRVDLLVNNAGFGKWGNFLDETLATYAEMMDLNMRAVVELCHAFLPGMAARGDCGVLNVGSTASYIPVPWSAVYGATKAFVLSFSEALYYEYRRKGVQITVLCPGNTESNFAAVANANAAKGKDAGDSPESVAKVGLDALLKGECSVISGSSNRQVAFLPRILSRKRVVTIAGETWRKRLRARGVTV